MTDNTETKQKQPILVVAPKLETPPVTLAKKGEKEERTIIDFRKKRPISNVEITCNDGTILYVNDGILMNLKVIKNLFNDIGVQNNIKVDADGDTVNTALNITGGRPFDIEDDALVLVLRFFHRYDAVDGIILRLPHFQKHIGLKFLDEMVRLRYDISVIIGQWLMGHLSFANAVPDWWYQRVMDHQPPRATVAGLIEHVFPHVMLQHNTDTIKYIKKVASLMARSQRPEIYHKLAHAVYKAPNVGIMNSLFTEAITVLTDNEDGVFDFEYDFKAYHRRSGPASTRLQEMKNIDALIKLRAANDACTGSILITGHEITPVSRNDSCATLSRRIAEIDYSGVDVWDIVCLLRNDSSAFQFITLLTDYETCTSEILWMIKKATLITLLDRCAIENHLRVANNIKIFNPRSTQITRKAASKNAR